MLRLAMLGSFSEMYCLRKLPGLFLMLFLLQEDVCSEERTRCSLESVLQDRGCSPVWVDKWLGNSLYSAILTTNLAISRWAAVVAVLPSWRLSCWLSLLARRGQLDPNCRAHIFLEGIMWLVAWAILECICSTLKGSLKTHAFLNENRKIAKLKWICSSERLVENTTNSH